MTNYFDLLSKQKNVLEEKGYTVAFISLYGSQNYNLEVYSSEYQSDVDMKAVIVPDLYDLVSNTKPVSKVYETEWGQVDVKDIRVFFETLLKANPAYIETLVTRYSVVDDRFEEQFDLVLSNVDTFIEKMKAQFARAIYGMMCEKEKAMSHPYPSIVHKIEKFGYDGKQVHHIYRLKLLMEDFFIENCSIDEAFIPLDHEKDFLTDLKLNKLTLKKVTPMVKTWMDRGKEIRDKVLSEIDESKIDYSIKQRYLDWSKQIIINSIKRNILFEELNKVLEEYK